MWNTGEMVDEKSKPQNTLLSFHANAFILQKSEMTFPQTLHVKRSCSFRNSFSNTKSFGEKNKGKKWIFSITQTKYRCVRVRFSGGISFTFPPGGSPRWRQTMTHHRLGRAAFLAIISSSFSLFKKLPTMCRIMSNSDKCLLLNDVKKYNQKKNPSYVIYANLLFSQISILKINIINANLCS